jgi:hypothetical protein
MSQLFSIRYYMMPILEDDIWGALLSRNETEIIQAGKLLTEEEIKAVLDHLQRMVTEEGWHPGQVESATIAINILTRS